MEIYIDYNATAPARPQVLEVVRELQGLPLNASSVHFYGRQAKAVLDNSRRQIAEIIGAFASEVVFTGSGTETNNWVMRAVSDREIFVSAIEHPSILKLAHKFIPVNSDGVIDLEKLEAILPENSMLSVMLANNETGVIQPIKEIAEIVHKKNGLLHCDAVQAFGKIPVDFTNLNCDLMTISAHKMGGIIGAAALVVKNNITIKPFLVGGGQERNYRAGTENIASIAGFAKACELIDFSAIANLRTWLDELENICGVENVIGKNALRLPNTACIVMPNVSAETQIINFDLSKIAISAGSACSSGRIEPSHVLKAMNIAPEKITNAIRISAGWQTSQADIVETGKVWKQIYGRKN